MKKIWFCFLEIVGKKKDTGELIKEFRKKGMKERIKKRLLDEVGIGGQGPKGSIDKYLQSAEFGRITGVSTRLAKEDYYTSKKRRIKLIDILKGLR